jgi:hypothetical protein
MKKTVTSRFRTKDEIKESKALTRYYEYWRDKRCKKIPECRDRFFLAFAAGWRSAMKFNK